jgi:hypothetical protein
MTRSTVLLPPIRTLHLPGHLLALIHRQGEELRSIGCANGSGKNALASWGCALSAACE